MLVRLVYRFLATLLCWLALLARSSASKNAGILIPRHEVAVLRRGNPRPGIDWTDRGVFVALARILPRQLRTNRIITPGTLLRWHQRRLTRKQTQPQAPGPPPRAGEVADMMVTLARDNPGWGVAGVPGELRRPGTPDRRGHHPHDLALAPDRAPGRERGPLAHLPCAPTPRRSWRRDFFHIDCAVSLTRLYVAFATGHHTRHGHLPGLTRSPAAAWATHRARELTAGLADAGRGFTHLIRDRDSTFTAASGAVFTACGTQVATTAPQAPRMNAIAGRFRTHGTS